MNHIFYIFLLIMMFGCETGQIINNAKPKGIDSKSVNNIAIAAETATRTWIRIRSASHIFFCLLYCWWLLQSVYGIRKIKVVL